jgi:hypothetical protein
VAGHRHQQARHRVVAATIFFGQIINRQADLEFAHGHQAIKQPRAIVALRGPGINLRARLQLTGDGLQQIAWR